VTNSQATGGYPLVNSPKASFLFVDDQAPVDPSCRKFNIVAAGRVVTFSGRVMCLNFASA